MGISMKTARFWIGAVVLIGLFSTQSIVAQLSKATHPQSKPTAQWMLNNGSQGKEFVFCLPMNDCPNCFVTARQIYVACSKNTLIDYEVPAVGFKKRVAVQANVVSVLDFSSFPMDEINESEKVSDMCFSIRSDDNVSVYVYNGKDVSSDGYLAIPVDSWGKEYYALTYPDFNEARNWKGGFCFFAAEDGTQVDIYLRSRTVGEYAASGLNTRTDGGHKYGDHWQVSLNRGQAYIVWGDGTTRGTFDLSGSRVVATKPIGFIDFHQRTMIPTFNLGGGRDYICEMVPPTTQWGKTYVAVEYLRGGLGDLYRAIAKEDGTNITWESFDFKTGNRINGPTPVFNMKAGEVRSLPKSPEEPSGGAGSSTEKSHGIQGMAIFRSNKPFQLMHECCSADWDNDNNYDPFTVYCIAQEQYTKATIFQCPQNSRYTNHFFNIIAVGDTADPSAKLLKSIVLDGKYLFAIYPSFLGNHIPGTNLYYARIPLANGSHNIYGDTPFGGEVYGYGAFDSYGWPAATAFKDLSKFDTLAPVLTRSVDCGDYTYLGTELRNFKINDTLSQVDTGIRDIDFVDTAIAKSFNYQIVLLTSDGKNITDTKIPAANSNFQVTWRLEVIDKSQNAYAKFFVQDRALNVAIDSVYYFAPKIKLSPDPVDFGNVRVGTTSTKTVWIHNDNDTLEYIKQIAMKDGSLFTVAHDSIDTLGLRINPRDSLLVTISYSPTTEAKDASSFDKDSLIVADDCARFKFLVRGRGVMPHIVVGDFNAGAVTVGSTVCNSTMQNNLLIQNTGTDTLHVTGIDMSSITPPFTLSNPTTPAFPFTIAPGKSVVFRTICFSPTDESNWRIDVTFLSDAPTTPKDDPVSTWTGSSNQPGPYIHGNDWDSVRLGVTKTLPCYVGNSGTSSVNCTGVDTMSGTNGQFRITRIYRQVSFQLFPNNDSVQVDVAFTPTTEGPKGPEIVAKFEETSEKHAFILGYGYLEKIKALGAEIVTPQLAGNSVTSQSAGEFVTIQNTSNSRWLTIHKIYLLSEPDDAANRIYSKDFSLRTITDTVLAIGDPTLQIPFTFTASLPGVEHAHVVIEHNAEPITANPTGMWRDTVLITAHSFVLNPPYVKGYDFGTVTACDNPTGGFIVGNSASAGSVNSDQIVDSMWVSGADGANFTLVNPPSSTAKLIIKPDTFVTVPINFAPIALVQRSYKVYVHVHFSDGRQLMDSVMANVTIASVNASIKFGQSNIDLSTSGPLTNASVNVNAGQWGGVQLKAFTIAVQYNRFDLSYIANSVQLGSMFDNTWRIDSVQVVDGTTPDMIELHISASGNTAVQSSGTFFTFRYQLLIDSMKTTQFQASVVDLVPYGRTNCVVLTYGNDSTSISGCYMDGRFIRVSDTPFMLQSVSPQPAQGGFVNIQYSVGFETSTSLDIVDESGRVVSTLNDQVLKAGAYTFLADVRALSSGVYRVRMRSAGHLYTSPLVIAK